MAHHKSCIKRIRSDKLRRERNRSATSRLRTAVKKVYACKSKSESENLLKEAFSAVDKGLKTGVVHKNNAANKKAKMSKFVNKLSA